MKVILDTNVLISGIFFGGQPRAVLDAWAEGWFELLVSPSIFDEYVRTCDRLAASHQGLEYHSVLATIIGRGHLVPDILPSGSVTNDPDDDKFMLCARANAAMIVSGDKHLLDVSGWQGVRVMRPHDFLAYLESPDVP
ncbi:putative toxin-antitoxin system toxin component, PIN family [Gemmatimonadota bacterium]